MGIRVELVSSIEREVGKWEDRKRVAVERAMVDLGLIVGLVEEYYDARRPVGERVVYEWEVCGGVEEFRRFLDGFMVVVGQYEGAEVRVSGK